MIQHYYNSAILRVREHIGGIDKLSRIKGETPQAYNARRKAYLRRKLNRKK